MASAPERSAPPDLAAGAPITLRSMQRFFEAASSAAKARFARWADRSNDRLGEKARASLHMPDDDFFDLDVLINHMVDDDEEEDLLDYSLEESDEAEDEVRERHRAAVLASLELNEDGLDTHDAFEVFHAARDVLQRAQIVLAEVVDELPPDQLFSPFALDREPLRRVRADSAALFGELTRAQRHELAIRLLKEQQRHGVCSKANISELFPSIAEEDELLVRGWMAEASRCSEAASGEREPSNNGSPDPRAQDFYSAALKTFGDARAFLALEASVGYRFRSNPSVETRIAIDGLRGLKELIGKRVVAFTAASAKAFKLHAAWGIMMDPSIWRDLPGLPGPEGAQPANCLMFAAAVRDPLLPAASSRYTDPVEKHFLAVHPALLMSAEHKLGVLYEISDCPRRKYRLARYWHRRAATRGHADSRFRLALHFLFGLRMEAAGYPEAFDALDWAAEAGHSPAAYLLRTHEGLLLDLLGRFVELEDNWACRAKARERLEAWRTKREPLWEVGTPRGDAWTAFHVPADDEDDPPLSRWHLYPPELFKVGGLLQARLWSLGCTWDTNDKVLPSEQRRGRRRSLPVECEVVLEKSHPRRATRLPKLELRDGVWQAASA